MTGPGAPGAIALGVVIGGLTEVPPKTQTEPEASECSKTMPPPAPPSPGGQPLSWEGQNLLTVARERGIEERLQEEQEKLQRQLDEPKLERRPRERPSKLAK